MFRIEVNVITGEQKTISLTPEEIAAIENAPPPAPQTPIPQPVTFAQLLIGLVNLGWITEAEGEAWLVGDLPAPITAVIDSLPAEDQFAAKARSIRPAQIDPADHLVAMLAAGRGMTEAEKDQFFIYCATL